MGEGAGVPGTFRDVASILPGTAAVAVSRSEIWTVGGGVLVVGLG